MFTNTASIQSKTAFFVQEYTHRVLTKMKETSNVTYYTLLDCQQIMCRTMNTYHELTSLEDQIKAYDTYTFALARSTAITQQVSEKLDLYPSIEEYNKTTERYYLRLVAESARKKVHLHNIQKLN